MVWVVKKRLKTSKDIEANSKYFLLNLFINAKEQRQPIADPKKTIPPNPPNFLSSILKSQKNIFSNVQSYSELFLDEKKGSSSQSKILGNTVDYFSPKKALEKNKEVSKDMKEKVSSLKAQKEKPTQNQKKTVNFNQQRMKYIVKLIMNHMILDP